MATEKRVRFRSWWLPWVLIAPQMAIVLVFFFWPAGLAVYQSVLTQDAFGTSSEFVGMENFQRLLASESYLASFKTTAIFSVLVAVFGLAIALLLAVMADAVVRGATVYKTLLIWPYAVAPAVAGVVWLFMFAPSVGIVSYALRAIGLDWNHLLNGTHAMTLIVLADRVVRGAHVYKTLLIWPYAVAPAIAGVLWAFLFAPSIGIVTYVLKGMGVDWNWILKGDQAMLLVVIAAVWNQISYNFLFFLAGLQSIPRSLIEAASIDGASPTRRFWTIVFPLLSPTTFFLLVVNLVYAFFNTFGIIDATTQGGPAQATQILVYKVYHDGVKASDLGGSSAQSVILMFIVIALTVVQFRYVERKVQY